MLRKSRNQWFWQSIRWTASPSLETTSTSSITLESEIHPDFSYLPPRGLGELLDAVIAHFPEQDGEEEDDDRPRIAIVGKT